MEPLTRLTSRLHFVCLQVTTTNNPCTDMRESGLQPQGHVLLDEYSKGGDAVSKLKMTSRVFELVSRDPGTSSHFISIIQSWTKETGGTSTLPVSKLAMFPPSQHFHIVNPPRI
ncbi:uncharacterized protein EAF02_011097 [Botrytis sinoallii]|uniref:uncharacterized protein n=1 Tax=Botrytis sinoallii TaxID=1463999 RepID=UPI0018FF4421|nr:uncharacterized protein EAF02_011097 [Botrytis sinoallii]KAF7858773.1 hypothetical protein EAF02_011097 [Botrytis sinoallii]